MFRWFCFKCCKMVWNCRTCSCGNTMEQNNELYKERERQKKIDRIMNGRRRGVMAEYISRETLLKAVEKMDRLDKESTPYEYDKEGYILLIQNAPTADVSEVKHGKWLVNKQCNHKPYRYKNPEKWVTYKCSECGYSNGRRKTKHCPECGAKMDGGEEE